MNATTGPNACAFISNTLDRNASARIDAGIAHQCLQLVPNKPEPARKLIQSLQSFVQWQSTLAWLKNPPESYTLPPTDIVGRLRNISATSTAGKFKSEYDFQLAIVETFNSAHDGHFNYWPDIFRAFYFTNDLATNIVSVSLDRVLVPKLYRRSHLNGTRTPPAITKINERDAVAFIEELSLRFSTFQDLDSQWNSQFPTHVRSDAEIAIGGSLAFQGDRITLSYDNGQTETQTSFANIRGRSAWRHITSGEEFYNRFCSPRAPGILPIENTSKEIFEIDPSTLSTPTAPTFKGYPSPVVRDNGNNSTSGYFLEGAGYEDVAVLALSSFAPNSLGHEYFRDFQSTVEAFLTRSRTAGKQRLIIDLTSNGGGYVLAGYELFSQLFPKAKKFQANNLRLADSLNDIANIVDSIRIDPATTPAKQIAFQSLLRDNIVSNLVPGHGVYKPDGTPFASARDILGPVELRGDRFTAYQMTPLNETGPKFNMTGTGHRTHPQPAVFSPENIVLLTDGTCGSTCTLFSYLMIIGQHVKSTVVGGRPVAGPMQSIAGVEGAQVFRFDQMSHIARQVIRFASKTGKANMTGEELSVLSEGYAISRAMNPTPGGTVNGKNQFSPKDMQTPLQFLMQPADCRFFYTAEMLSTPEAVWQRTIDATWTNPEAYCVHGSRAPSADTRKVVPSNASLARGSWGLFAKIVSLVMVFAGVLST